MTRRIGRRPGLVRLGNDEDRWVATGKVSGATAVVGLFHTGRHRRSRAHWCGRALKIHVRWCVLPFSSMFSWKGVEYVTHSTGIAWKISVRIIGKRLGWWTPRSKARTPSWVGVGEKARSTRGGMDHGRAQKHITTNFCSSFHLRYTNLS